MQIKYEVSAYLIYQILEFVINLMSLQLPNDLIFEKNLIFSILSAMIGQACTAEQNAFLMLSKL